MEAPRISHMPDNRLRAIGLLELGDRAGAELQRQSGDRVEMVRLRRADDRRRHIRVRQQPCQSEDRQLDGMPLRGFDKVPAPGRRED